MGKIFYPTDIREVFYNVVDRIKEELHPEFILISGSFGKDSWLYAGEKLLSDFEFVFINEKKWSLKNKKKLLSKLNSKFPYDISLKGYLLKNIQNKVISNYSFKNPGYLTLDFFDTFKDPQILYSKNPDSSALPIISNKEVPVWEAWRLLVNRLGDLLFLTVNNREHNAEESNYYWLKAFESSADSYLLIHNVYSPNIHEKISSFSQSLLNNDKALNSICRGSYDLLLNAFIAREKHDISFFNISHIQNEERIKIVNNWMLYIQEKMISLEGIISNGENYYENYLLNNELQNKYLETNLRHNVMFSNLIRIIYHPKLLISGINYFDINKSWRHIILLTIASTFNEYSRNELNFPQSKKIFKLLKIGKSVDNLYGKGFITEVLRCWKLLR